MQVFQDGHYISEADVVRHATYDTTVLCTHVEDVQAYNAAILEKMAADGLVQDVKPVPLRHNVKTDEEYELHSAWMQDPAFHTLKEVGVGARVLVTENCDLSAGTANGATGTVVGVEEGEDKDDPEVLLVKCVRVNMDWTRKTANVYARTMANKNHNGKTYTKHAHPLMLAWAITAHRSQVRHVWYGTCGSLAPTPPCSILCSVALCAPLCWAVVRCCAFHSVLYWGPRQLPTLCTIQAPTPGRCTFLARLHRAGQSMAPPSSTCATSSHPASSTSCCRESPGQT